MSDEGREITLYRLFDHDICVFSASCIIRSIQFEVMIEAEKETRVWFIPPMVYKKLMEESAAVANYTNEIMATRFTDVMWLLEEAQLEGTNQLKITHEAIANHLGTHREVITRMLRYFQSEGMVKLMRGVVEITDEKKLEKLQDA